MARYQKQNDVPTQDQNKYEKRNTKRCEEKKEEEGGYNIY